MIKIPKNIQKIIDGLPPVVGVSPNALSRVVPASFLKNYLVLCFKNRGETGFAKKDAEVFCVEEKFPDVTMEKQSTKAILVVPQVTKMLSKKKNFWLIVYKPMPKLEELCDTNGWNLIANRYAMRQMLENKKNFREALVSSGIEAIPGKSFKVSDFTLGLYEQLVCEFGQKLVFQLAEMMDGGGYGTFFINSESDYQVFLRRIEEIKKKEEPLEFINVTKFIEGIPASIISCATKKGTITGSFQAQIQDIALVNDPSKGSGLYCGHDWQFLAGKAKATTRAKQIAQKFGDYIYSRGYKGIFGMDLLVDPESEEVYPVECNPRLTDLFPVISMNCLKAGIIPMDLYHILEFIHPEYEFDPKEISKSFDKLLPCSQLILKTKNNKHMQMNGNLRAGIYSFNELGEITFEKDGYRHEDIENDNQFLVTEGVASHGHIYSAQARVCRVVFARSALMSKNTLYPQIENVIRNIYKMVDLREVISDNKEGI